MADFPLTHPGAVPREDFLKPPGPGRHALAAELVTVDRKLARADANLRQ